MSELNREQIIKALECCVKEWDCAFCRFSKLECASIKRDALALVKKLTAENEKLNKLLEHCEDDGEYWEGKYNNAVADTVQKMQERIAQHATNGYPRKVRLDVVDRIANEMLEDK